jgi:hypothetical protein
VIAELLSGVSASIAAPLLRNWWRSRFRGRVERTRSEKTELDFDDEEKIKKIVAESIEKTIGPD